MRVWVWKWVCGLNPSWIQEWRWKASGEHPSNMLKMQYISADYELEWLKTSLGAWSISTTTKIQKICFSLVLCVRIWTNRIIHRAVYLKRKRLFVIQEKWCLFCYLFGSIHNILDLFIIRITLITPIDIDTTYKCICTMHTVWNYRQDDVVAIGQTYQICYLFVITLYDKIFNSRFATENYYVYFVIGYVWHLSHNSQIINNFIFIVCRVQDTGCWVLNKMDPFQLEKSNRYDG